MTDPAVSTWSEWSRHVLKELERLNTNYQNLTSEIQNLKNKDQAILILDKELTALKHWQDDVTEVASVTDLKDALLKLDSLNSFKIQAVTVWAMVQLAFGVVTWFLHHG